MTDINTLKVERNKLQEHIEIVDADISVTTDAVDRLRSRIVQSPERIKRTITTMGATVNEDKKQVSLYENKARDLQVKIAALATIEKDLRGCVEQLQTIEKEVHLLEASKKEVMDLNDHLDNRKVERSELQMRQSVRLTSSLL